MLKWHHYKNIPTSFLKKKKLGSNFKLICIAYPFGKNPGWQLAKIIIFVSGLVGVSVLYDFAYTTSSFAFTMSKNRGNLNSSLKLKGQLPDGSHPKSTLSCN